MSTFQQQVAGHIAQYKKRMRVVAKESVQDVVADAQTVRARGGRMRVKTGFLRASINAAIGRMPSGQSVNSGQVQSPIQGSGIAAALLRWNPEKDETIFVGWTADYARPREYVDGFLRGAVEKWPQIVNQNAKKVQ